jgi:histidinol-phosphate/aromatic aminotransferase/cobyric acid decarboxylase-like protein
VRYFATPELRDALRITVGTDDEIAVLVRVLDQLVS